MREDYQSTYDQYMEQNKEISELKEQYSKVCTAYIRFRKNMEDLLNGSAEK